MQKVWYSLSSGWSLQLYIRLRCISALNMIISPSLSDSGLPAHNVYIPARCHYIDAHKAEKSSQYQNTCVERSNEDKMPCLSKNYFVGDRIELMTFATPVKCLNHSTTTSLPLSLSPAMDRWNPWRVLSHICIHIVGMEYENVLLKGLPANTDRFDRWEL